MVKILRKEFIKMEREFSRCRFDLVCDDFSDLPEPNSFDIWLIDMGSTAHIINTGETYMLNSAGEWKPQKKTDEEGGVTFTEEDKAKLDSLKNSDSRISQLESLVKNYHDTVVYGWHIDPNESDPSEAVTYLADAVGMTPAKMETDTFDYGSWKNAFFMPKPCMLRYDGTVAYYLDPNDYSKKIDGTPSDVSNPAFEGNAMMEWGLIWYKFEGGDKDGEGYFYVSNCQIDESYHCWCNYDSKDNITPHFYTAIYNGTGTDKMRSISGVALTPANGNGNTTTTTEVTRATANNIDSDNVEWYIEVWADRLLINALLVLMGKSLNTQNVFGRGLDSGGLEVKEAYTTGTLNDKGLFWGVTSVGTSAVKVFGMENYWGCTYRRVLGCLIIDQVLKIKLTYGTADGSAVKGYDLIGEGYIENDITHDAKGYVSAMKFSKYGYMTSAVDGSSSSYYCDYFYQGVGRRYLLIGGGSDAGLSVGAFYFYMDSTSSGSNHLIAAALSCKPLANKEA